MAGRTGPARLEVRPVPRVSVIVPAFNARPYLDETIASVVAQSLSDWELVVVDDGSTDGSADVADGWARRDTRVQLVRQTNRGVAAARNAGFAASHIAAEYLALGDPCVQAGLRDLGGFFVVISLLARGR